MSALLTLLSDTLSFCTLPRMKMISCGSEASWGLAAWPHGLLSSVMGEMHGSPELCFTDGSSRGSRLLSCFRPLETSKMVLS